MAEEPKNDLRKNLPNGFVWMFVGLFLIVLLAQNYLDTRVGKVSFSYQLEHLVNLQLLQPEESRKIALNDNLVTFSGHFRDRLTDEGKARFKYIELLDTSHLLKQNQEQLVRDLGQNRSKVQDAAGFFLALTGMPLPKEGYLVVETPYEGANGGGQAYTVVVQQLPKRTGPTLADLKAQAGSLASGGAVKPLGKALEDLIQDFRSSQLGIGSEAMKQTLKTQEELVAAANSSDKEVLPVYTKALGELQFIVNELNEFDDHARLVQLRSVRTYRDLLAENDKLTAQVEENEAQLDKARQAVAAVVWFFNNQELSTRSLERQDPEVFHQWYTNAHDEWSHFADNQGSTFKAPDQPLNTVLEKTFKSEEPTPNYLSYVFTLMPIFLVLGVLYALFARQMKGMGSGPMSFGKSPARLVLPKGPNKITFKDVAGVDEAIEELQEIVEFLKNPQRFTSLGGRIPKGVLCIGPPGTGKTLLAKAVAGEADRPFFSISGSDFVEMFVGVGASRIRDLFGEAKKNAPCIVFIDEIDAVGRHRGVGVGGGHDEREQTLNQLLVEMDGFDTNEGVILMAATNRPDVLDKALLRPGRFDRRVVVSLPDVKGRFDILKVHARKIKMDPTVDLMLLARSTPGCSGADLSNILNEAALLAARKGRSAVTAQEVGEARDKVLYGKERRSLEIDAHEKRTTAYHEAGHALVSLSVKHGDPIDKVTIIPRGLSLGATMFTPKKTRVSYWKNEIIDQLAVLMGGRCAEELFLEDISSGAQQDIERATQLARSMVCKWGMSRLGAVDYDPRGDNGGYGDYGYHEKKYSEQTALAIDDEVHTILDAAYEEAKRILTEKRQQVEIMVQALIEFETLDTDDVSNIIEGKWHVEGKRERLKMAEELHKKSAATPPPPPAEAKVQPEMA